MGATVRGREANRFMAIAKDRIKIDIKKLEALIEGYADGCVATDEHDEIVTDNNGNELSTLDVAIATLNEDEKLTIDEFISSILGKNVMGYEEDIHPDIKKIVREAETADGLPYGSTPYRGVTLYWNEKGSPYEKLNELMGEILEDLHVKINISLTV